MYLIDILSVIYPLYLSVQAIKTLDIKSLSSALTFWISWFVLVNCYDIAMGLLWILPFISILTLVKIFLVFVLYSKSVNELIRKAIIHPNTLDGVKEFIGVVKHYTRTIKEKWPKLLNWIKGDWLDLNIH